MTRADVVVVGAGPAGATAACSLAKRGFEVLLLDRAEFPRDKPCGEFVNPAACRLIEQVFQRPLSNLCSLGAVPVSEILLQLEKEPPVAIPMLDVAGEPVEGVSMPRLTLDRLLLEDCRQAGVQVAEGHSVQEVRLVKEGVVVSGRASEHHAFEISAKLALAADGTHSRIARTLGLTKAEPALASIGIVAHLVGLKPDAANDRTVWMFPANRDSSTFGFARQGAGRAVLSGSVPKSCAAKISDNPEAFLRSWILGRKPLFFALGDEWEFECVKTVPCFGHRLERVCAGRVIFLGDAARFVDPFTGEGIHHAIESGILAANAASRALHSDVDLARALARYESDRAGLDSSYRLCGIVRSICLRTGLVNYIGERLRRRPKLAETLVGAITDMLPAKAVLNPSFAIRALGP